MACRRIEVLPKDLPDPDDQPRKRIAVFLPEWLIDEVDKLIALHNFHDDEIFKYRSRYMETAIKFFNRNLYALAIGSHGNEK